MARLTTLGLFDCSWLSSIFDILPSSGEYPDLERRPIDGPNKLGNYMLGAAQWVIRPDECRYVYRRCQEEEGAGERRVQWSMGHWREWKRQFGFVAGDGRFAEKYRDLARQAYLQMTACEEGR